MSTRHFNSCSQPVAGDGGAKERQTGTVDSRSFPGHPGTSSSSTPLKAKRSLSDDRGKVASLSALPVEGLDVDDGKPLLESAWMSIVGAAGKFLGRAQERHQWSDARMGMMNRLLCKNKSGTSQRAEDEETFRYYSSYYAVRNSDAPPSHKNSMNSMHSPADNDMLLTSISNRASPQVAGRASDWGDNAANALQLRDRDHRGKGSGEFYLPRLSVGQTSASGLGQSADAILAIEHDSIGRRVAGDARRRGEEARQSGSGSNSTRHSIPAMPPIPRQQQQQQQQQLQPQLSTEPSEDHLHDLLNKLRARRLGGGQHEPSLDAGASGSGSGARRGMVQASHDFGAAEVQGARRPPAVGQGSAGRVPLGQRFSAHLASDLERQAKPADAFNSRHSAVVMSYACDTVTTNRINSWLAKASPYQGEGPIDDNAAPEPAAQLLRKGPCCSAANEDSPRCSPDVDSVANDAGERDSQPQGSRRITLHGVDSLDPRPVDARPWRSMNGTMKEAVPVPAPETPDSQADAQGSNSSRTAGPRVQFVSSRLGSTSFKDHR